ncbi:response regulator [Steroidobacter flavus]|uniref:Response regulator n=1 Tax=Steroidobacter flavus TaxID=1842136 RepID=A0ABV8SVX9_9GAMM
MHFLIIDDDFLARSGVVRTLETLSPGATVREAETLQDAFHMLEQAPAVDLVFLDLNLHHTQGIDTLVQFRGWCEARDMEPRTVVLSGAADNNLQLLNDVLANHGTGFIIKGTKAKVFESALTITIEGGIYIPEEFLKIGGKDPAPPKETLNLTPREKEVAALLIQGRTYKGIASELQKRHKQSVSDKTVRTHVGNIAWKLGVTASAKAGVMAEIARRGLKFD